MQERSLKRMKKNNSEKKLGSFVRGLNSSEENTAHG